MGVIGVPAFFVLILGIVALKRGHLSWARITNRRTAGIVTGVAGVVLVTAVALDPPPPAPVAAPAPVTTTTSTAPATTAVPTTITPAPATTAVAPPSTIAPTQTTAARATSTTVTPPVVPAIVYPPTTLDQFKAFARTGNPTAIHPYKSEAVGAVGICPQPRIEATADANLPVRELQADEAAFFLQRGYLDQNCGGVLFLFDSPSTSHDGGYNVGRVLYDVGSSDPAHRLEVDTSDITPAGSFTLNY